MHHFKSITRYLILLSALSMTSLHSPLLLADQSDDKNALQTAITAQESAMSAGDAAGTVQYDAPNYKEWDFHGNLGIHNKAEDLKQVSANIKNCRSISIQSTVTSVKFAGNKATVMVSKEGTITLIQNGKDIPVSYKSTQKQLWEKTSSGWIEDSAHSLTLTIKPLSGG